MYTLLLVEDEHIIRAGLKKIILQMDLGISSIFEASSGIEATTIAIKEQPDIIITDIQMEQGDGLSFINSILSTGLASRTIILSGFNEFTYAQTAISYGVSSYLLKPIKKPYLLEAINKVISSRRRAQDLIKDYSQWELHASKLVNLLHVFHPVSNIEVEAAFAEANITLDYEFIAFITIHYGQNKINYKDIHQLFNTMFSSLMIKLCLCYENIPNHLTLIINFHNTEDIKKIERSLIMNLEKLKCEKIVEEFDVYKNDQKINQDERFSQPIYLGVSEVSNQLGIFPTLVQQSLLALDFRLLRPATHLFQYRELKELPSQLPTVQLFIQSLTNAIRDNQKLEVNRVVKEWFQAVLSLPDVAPHRIIVTLNQIQTLIAVNSSHIATANSNIDIGYLYRGSASFDIFIDRIQNFFLTLCDSYSRSINNYDSNPISVIIEYLEQHFNKSITLQEAANKLFINPSYFSYLFKKKTGISFIQYLQKLRVEKSKSLLQNPQLKIYEVANKVGFVDEKYYSKVFKALTGLTPQEYRDRSRPISNSNY